MKKLLLLTLLVSGTAWADCEDNATSFAEVIGCLNTDVASLKKELNSTYAALYKQTEAKKELDAAQKAWLVYKEKQCGDFTLAEAGANTSQMAFDLSCQATLYQDRIEYLKLLTTH